MKWILGSLLILLLLLQYEFWFSDGGMRTVWQLEKNITKQQTVNAELEKRNQSLVVEIKSLKSGDAAVESSARADLGMIRSDETFYQVVKK